MTLVDADRADEIYAEMGPATETSGGSAGEHRPSASRRSAGAAAFIGRVADDTFGKVFAHDLRSVGVHFDAPPATDGPPTGRCLVIVTPDARAHDVHVPRRGRRARPERTSTQLDRRERRGHVPRGLPLGPARGEGRVPPRGRRSRTAPIAGSRSRSPIRSASSATATSSSSSSTTHVDILFANEDEITIALRGRRLRRRAAPGARHCEIAALTRGAQGSVIVARRRACT